MCEPLCDWLWHTPSTSGSLQCKHCNRHCNEGRARIRIVAASVALSLYVLPSGCSEEVTQGPTQAAGNRWGEKKVLNSSRRTNQACL